MRFNRYIAFSIVASSVLCGQAYTGWNGGQFNDGDTVNISYDPSTTQNNTQILKQSINLVSGTMTATISAGTLQQGALPAGGFVGNFNNGTITFGSTGANLIFRISKGQYSLGADTAFAFKNTSFTANANIDAQFTGGGTLFQANGGSLNFQGDTTLQGSTVISTTGNTTLNINQNGGKKVDINGAINLNGGTSNIKLDSNDDKVTGTISATGGITTLSLSGGSQINGTFSGNNNSNLNLTIDNATYNGNVDNSGTSNITIKNNGILQGNLTTQGTTTLTMSSGNINGDSTISGSTFTAMITGSSTLGNLTSTATTNKFDASGATTKNLSFTGQNNAIQIVNHSNINGTLTTVEKGNLTNITVKDSIINKIEHLDSQFQANITNATINQGVTVNNGATIALVNTLGNTQINGTSLLSANQNQIKLNGDSGGGIFNYNGATTNNLLSYGNNTIQSATMIGNGTNSTLIHGTKLTITGDLSATGSKNQVGVMNTNSSLLVQGNVNLKATTNNVASLQNGTIQGTLTTSGATQVSSGQVGNTKINGGIRHSNGDLSATFGQNSIISNGIITEGQQGIANILFRGNSQLKGNSSFDNATNQVTLNDTASVTGNIAFNETSSLIANSSTTIAGQISTNSGTATHTLSGSATITGGIDTEAGATSTIVNFGENSKIQNGTSTFNSDIDITFAGSSKVINEKFNVAQGTANITFKENAEMQGGSITNNGGNANIIFQDNSKMTSGGSINTENGTTKLDAKNSANLTGTITQSGGNFTGIFEDSSQFNGNATQSGGTSNIKFQNQSKWTGNFNQSGSTSSSTITFNDTANMQGDITTTDGETNITFNNGTKIVGNIAAQGTKNQVTFDTARLEGNLTLDGFGDIMGYSKGDFTSSFITGDVQGYDEVILNLSSTQVGGYIHQGSSANNSGITGNFTDSQILGGFAGTDSINELDVTHSQIDKGIAQSNGSLTATIKTTIVAGGFEGTNNSKNDITMTQGSLTGGIKQTTGSLDFKSQGTNIAGDFTGWDSTNTLKTANGSFSGDINQVFGSLNAEMISMTDLKNFSGESSENVIHLSNTEIQAISQSSGSLEFNTNSNVKGNITGSNGSINTISIVGSNVTGTISQDTGSMDLTLLNSNAQDQIKSNKANFGLYATNAIIEKNITLTDSASNGISDNLTLNGSFTQSNGTSTMTFSNTQFMNTTTITNATSASLIFSKSTIQDISTTRGITAFNLANSTMGNFGGNMGQHSITLVKSTAQAFTQQGGSITLNASNNSEVASVDGSNFSNVSVTLDRSEITGSVKNNGETTISMQDSTIGVNVEQIGTTLSFTASNSTLTGQYKQTDGTSMVNFMNSKINGGIDLTTLANGTMNFTQGSQIQSGIKANDSRFTFMLLSNSSLEGGFTQDKGVVTGTIDESTLNGGMTLSNGTTNFSFYNGSTLNGDIVATDHNTTILVDRSTINGNMTIRGGSFALTAQNGSTIQGNANGTKGQVNVTDADFKLILDTSSRFNGDITQNGNKQTILVKQNSTLDGSITNTDVTSSISVNNATITGNITQNQGSLALDLSNGGKVNGNISLNNSNTTLSGSGMGNQIGGNFTQTNGTLTGSMNGLTLTGTYSQNGGDSSVSFTNSTFNSDTTITNATSSSLTFDASTLKSYSISGGTNNTLKLLNGTTMTGKLTLSNNATATLKMDGSTIKGNIDAQNNSTLNFNTFNSEVTGTTTINTGGLTGTADSTNFGDSFTLTDTTSNVSFTNGSVINGNVTATGANSNNTIKFDNSSITGNFSQEGGTINLDLSNGSSIGQNLTFTDTTATLTGSGAENSIKGNFDSTRTQLTGDASGLNLKGTFTQTNGSSSIAFRNNSLFEGKMTLNGGTSDINFLTNSGVRNEIGIKDQDRAYLGLLGRSFIEGNINIENTALATLSTQSSSTITGDISLNNSATTFMLGNQSSYNGTLTQEGNTLSITASNSTLDSTINLNNGSTDISLSSGSNLTGTITANANPLEMTLSNSSFNSMEAPQNITITDANFTLTASDNSVFGGNLTQSSNNANALTSNLTFNSNSYYSGIINLNNVTLKANFNQSGIFSNDIKISGASALFAFDGSTNGGVIQRFEATNTNLNINTTNQSHITINDLQMNGNNLNLTATNSSRLTANVTLNNTTTATYTANTNGNLNVNTHIANQASSFTATISGGILQGSITQDPNGNNGFPNGEITLQSVGENGGRWAVTGDTQIKSLTLNNTQEALFSDAIFASTFNSPLSFVDFTLEFEDEGATSRVGKEIIRKPEPINGQPIPEAGEGRTYVRQLQANEISGNNGLFRVYADLGTNLADNILASKASGDHLIQVQYRAATFREIGGDRIVVAKVTDPSTSVSFKGTQSEIGLTKYDTEIIKENAADGNGFEWIIGQATPAGMSYSSKIVASILQSQYRSFMIEIDSLDRRLGDLEFIKRDKGFWIRSYIGSNTKEATDFSTLAKDDYYSIWSGFDYNSIGLTVHNYVGVFFNYTGINTESKDYTGKSSNIAFGFYNTFKAFSGFYADLLAKYIYTMSEFDIINYSLAKNAPKIDNHKFLLNAEIGYSFYYGEKGKSGYIQPQFQVTSGYIHKTDLSVVDVSGETINATIGRNFPVSIRTGVFWGQVFGEKIKSHIKLGTSFVYDVDSGGVLDFSDSSTELQFRQGDDFRWVLSASTDFTFSEFFKLYASFDTSFFGNYNTTYSANIGMRFTFGRSNNYVKNVPMVYNPYTPPVAINDDKRTVPVVKRYTTQDIDQNYVGKPRKIESYIQGNQSPNNQPTYEGGYSYPSRQPHRDITSEVSF